MRLSVPQLHIILYIKKGNDHLSNRSQQRQQQQNKIEEKYISNKNEMLMYIICMDGNAHLIFG